jgi:hypothetical protein
MSDGHKEICLCPYCAAEIATSATRCWCCRRVFLQGAKEYCAVERDGVVVKAVNPTKFQYSLASLLLITLLVAVLSSIFVIQPLAGIVATVSALIGLIRTSQLSMRNRSLGNPLTTKRKLVIFFKWFSGTVLLLFSVIVLAFTAIWILIVYNGIK